MTTRAQIIAVAEKGRPTCRDFDKIEGFPGCCNSCHDDADEGYGELCHSDIPITSGTTEASVCCKVMLWIDAELLKPE